MSDKPSSSHRNDTDVNTDEHRIFLHKDLTYKIIGFVYEIRKEYGPGHKENVYGNLLAELLDKESINYEKEKI